MEIQAYSAFGADASLKFDLDALNFPEGIGCWGYAPGHSVSAWDGTQLLVRCAQSPSLLDTATSERAGDGRAARPVSSRPPVWSVAQPPPRLALAGQQPGAALTSSLWIEGRPPCPPPACLPIMPPSACLPNGCAASLPACPLQVNVERSGAVESVANVTDIHETLDLAGALSTRV